MHKNGLIDERSLREELARYQFYHVIQLTETVSTPGWDHPVVRRNQRMMIEAMRQLDLRGKRVLDVGCRDGLFSFEAETLGAKEVVGIDNDLSPGAVEVLIPFLRSKVRMAELNVNDLSPEHFGRFDVILCAGLLYHLRFPFWGLQRLRDVLKPGGTLLLETAIVHDDHPHALLYCPVGAESPYEPTSCSFFNVKGLCDSLHSLGFAVERAVYLHSDPQHLRRYWPRFKRRLKALFGFGKGLCVDRAVYACQAGPVGAAIASERVLEYWHGRHRIHTVQRNDLEMAARGK